MCIIFGVESGSNFVGFLWDLLATDVELHAATTYCALGFGLAALIILLLPELLGPNLS